MSLLSLCPFTSPHLPFPSPSACQLSAPKEPALALSRPAGHVDWHSLQQQHRYTVTGTLDHHNFSATFIYQTHCISNHRCQLFFFFFNTYKDEKRKRQKRKVCNVQTNCINWLSWAHPCRGACDSAFKWSAVQFYNCTLVQSNIQYLNYCCNWKIRILSKSEWRLKKIGRHPIS